MSTELFATLPVRVTVPVLTVRAVVSVALVTVPAFPVTEPTIAFVASMSVAQSLVIREPVSPIEPVMVIELVVKARLPHDTVNPPVAVATVIFADQSKLTHPIVLAVVSIGAETIVITGVVVPVAIVACAKSAEVTSVTVPPDATVAHVPSSRRNLPRFVPFGTNPC